MPGSAERRKKCRSPQTLPCHKRKSSVQPRRRYKRSEWRDSKLRAESAGDLASRKKSFRKSVRSSSAAQHGSKLNAQEKSSAASSKGCTLFPVDVTDCLKNVSDWEAMEIRILDKDKCTVLRPNVSDTQRSDQVLVRPSLYQTDHTLKGSTRSNQNTSRGSSVLKQTVCVEKVHVRNLLHTKREKCGNLGSSRSTEYMPSETTTLAGTLTNEMDNLKYFRISGSNIGLFSPKEHSDACSGHSADTSDLETGSAHILHTRCETGGSRATKDSSPAPRGQDGQQLEDDSSSKESGQCTTDNDEDSENENGSGEDESDDDDDDDDENEMDEDEEGRESDEESVQSSISDDSYYKKYYKEELNNTKLKTAIEINAEGKQMVSESEDATFTSPFVPHKNTIDNQSAVSNTQCTNADLSSSRLNWQKAVCNQTIPPSHHIDSNEDNKHKTHAKDWPVIPNENQKALGHIPYYSDNEDRPFFMQQGEPALNLNEPSTSLSISEGNKWDTLPHNQDCFSSTQSLSTLTSATARKASFIPMPEEEIARYKQIALQILTERKQRALEDNQNTNVLSTAPHNVVQVQPQQTTKKKRNRPSRKYHKSTRLKSKDAKTSEACQNTSGRSSQRAGFWASWRIKNQIEKHRKRFHSSDVNTSRGCRPRNTHAFSAGRCLQRSPKLTAHKDRNSDIEYISYCPGFTPVKFGSITQKATPQPIGRIQSKRLSCPILETLKSKHESTVTGTKVSNAPFKIQKPPAKTHSSLFGSHHLTVKKSSASIPVTMRSTQSHYYLKPSVHSHVGTKKMANMSAHPLHDGKVRTQYEHGTKAYQASAKTYTRRPTRGCNTGQGKSCMVFANEKLNGFNCESTPIEGKLKVTSQADDTHAKEAPSKLESFSKTITKAEAPNPWKFNVNNSPGTNQNLPKNLCLPSFANRQNERAKTPNLPTTATHEQEAIPVEDTTDSLKPRAYLDLVQNILKSPTAKAAQALGTFLQKPEAQEPLDRTCDITVDQIISSYQKLFDQLYDLSSKTTVNDKPKINENITRSLESSHKLIEAIRPKDTKPQNTTLTAVKKVPAASQTHFKSAVIVNQNSLNSSDEIECDKNVSLNESNDCLPGATGGVDRNKSSWKSKENTKSALHAADQATSKLFKCNTIQTGTRSRATGSAGMFRLPGRSCGNHDSRHVWRRSTTPDKRSATENRLTFKHIENRKSKSSHDSSETVNTTCKFNHTQRKPAFEVRSSRTSCLGMLEDNHQQSHVWGRICRNATTETSNKPTFAKAARKISFSDSSCCGIKPKVNTFLKTSFSCTRQPTAASRMNKDEHPVYKCRNISQLKDMSDKIQSDGRRKCTEQTVTKPTHVGLINASAGTSLQCMTAIQSNPECSGRMTNKFLVHKECASSIQAHALVTSAQASARMVTTDRTKLAGQGQPSINDMSIVVRDADADNEKRELSAQSLQIEGQYHQIHERWKSNRPVKCSTHSAGMVKAYPAITIFAPQACLNILTPRPPASSHGSTAAAKETVSELQVVNNVSQATSQLCLPVTAESELPNDQSIEPLGSNEDNIHDDKLIKERKDSVAIKLTNATTQRRPIRSVLKSNSEQWTRRDENCCRNMLRDIPNGVAPEGQKHLKSRNVFRYGLSASSSVLTQVPSQREQNTSALMRPHKKCTRITPCGPFYHEPTGGVPQTTEGKTGARNCTSHPSPCLAATTDISGTDTARCTPSADAEMTLFVPPEPSLREADKKINMKPHANNSHGVQHTSLKNISARRVTPAEVCPPEGLGTAKSQTPRLDRRASLSWSKQHLTKSQEVKDKHFVTSTALRAIFVTPFSPFHRVDDHHLGDTEGSRRPLAWQQRRCRSAEGFEIKNATSRVFTYGKKKLPPECFSSSAVRKSLKSDAQLRASASNCTLRHDSSRGQVTCAGAASNCTLRHDSSRGQVTCAEAAKQAEVKTEGCTDSKPTGEIGNPQHGGGAFHIVHNPANTPVKPHGSTMNASPSKKDLKIYDRWSTPPWKPTVSEDESELSDGSSLQAVRKHIVANTCRMIIRESRNLIVSNLQRHTREDSPEKSIPADNGRDHKSAEGQTHDSCVLTATNQVINDAKGSKSLTSVVENNEDPKVPESGHNYQIPGASTETWESKHVAKQSVFSSKSATQGSACQLIATDQHLLSTNITGEPANHKPGKCGSMPSEGARLTKPEISLDNPSAPGVEYGEGKEPDGHIKDLSVPSKRAKQCQPTHNGTISPASERFPEKDICDGSEINKQLPNNNTVIPVLENKLATKQMQFAEQQMRNVTLEVSDTTHGSQSGHHDFQQDANDSRDIASTLLSADQEQKTKREVQENTNADRHGRGEEQNNENSYQEIVGRRDQAINFTQQKTREFGPENGNTHNVNVSQKSQDNDNSEAMNNKEPESDEVWQNDHNTWQKGRNIQQQQKGAYQNLRDTIQTAKEESKDKEYSVRQQGQGKNETVQKNRNSDKGSGDVKHQNRKVEHEDHGNEQEFTALEYESSSAMQETRERATQSVYTGQENGDTRQRSRNVDEKSSYILQRCKNTDKRTGDKQQDSVREREEKNRTTNEKKIEHCSGEIVQKRKDNGQRIRDVPAYNKSMEHEDKKQNRNTENEGIDKWRKCRTIERGRIGTRQKSRSAERKMSDISQTNKSAERVSTDSSQHSRSVDRGVTETGPTVRGLKSQSRQVDNKHSDTGEESTETIGNQTSAERNREVGHQMRNGEPTRGERGVHISVIREKTRNKAQINNKTQYNKRKNTWSQERNNGYNEKYEAQHVREKRFEQRMLQEGRNERHELRDADTEERDKRHERRGTCLREGNNQQTVIDRQETGKRLEERSSSQEERVNRSGERYTDREDSDERYEQRDSEQDERNKEYDSTDAQQESENDSAESDGELEERDEDYHKRDMELPARRVYNEYGKIATTAEKHMGTREHNLEGDHESTDNMQDSRYSDGGSCMQQTRQQDCNGAEKSPRTRCKNIGKPAYETRAISATYKRPSKGSREFGQEIRGKVGMIGRNDQGKKDLRHPSRDTKPISTNHKSRSVGYESNDSDLEGSRVMRQDNRSAEIKVKHRMQRVGNQQHRNSNREQAMTGSGQERASQLYIPRNIKQAGRDAIDERGHTGPQVSQQNTSESEDEAYFSATRKGRTELAEKSGVCGRKPATNRGPWKMPHPPQHKIASVANTTQTEESCLVTLTSPRKCVQTRDQHTETEDILAPPTKGDRDKMGETEPSLQENNIYTRLEQQHHSSAETFTFLTDNLTGLRDSPEELQPFNLPYQKTEESPIPQMYASELDEMQIKSQGESLRRSKLCGQALVNDESSLLNNLSEMHTSMPLLPVVESTSVLVKTLSLTDSLASMRGSKRLNLGKRSKSCETVVASHQDTISYLYDGAYHSTRSTHKRIWNTDRELVIGREANSSSKSLLKLPEDNCDIHALQSLPQSAMGHWRPDISTDNIDGLVNETEITRADTCRWKLLPMFKPSTDNTCVDLSTCDGGSWHNSSSGKERSHFLLNVKTDTMKAHIHHHQTNETKDDTLKVHTSHKQENKPKVQTQQRKDTSDDTTEVHTHHQQRNATRDDTMEGPTQHQRMNEPKEAGFPTLVDVDQETVVASQQLHNVGDSSRTHGKRDLVVMCTSTIHVKPVHMWVDTIDNVADTASADARAGVRDTAPTDTRVGVRDTLICESAIINPDVLHTEHSEAEAHPRESFIPHRTINRETNHVFKSTSRNNPKDPKDEIVVGPGYLTSHSASSTGHSSIVKSAQPRGSLDTQKTIQVVTTISSIAFDNCGFYSNNVQQGVHSEMPHISVNNFSTGDLQIDTSIATDSPCDFMDEPKPEIETLFQTRLSGEGITASQARLQGRRKCNETLFEERRASLFPDRPKDTKTRRTEQSDSLQSKHADDVSARNNQVMIVPLGKCSEKPCGHFQRHGSLSPHLPENTETTHTEQTDSSQRVHADDVSASNSQEMIAPRDTIHSNEGYAQDCPPAPRGGDSSACLHGTDQTSCSLSHTASRSHMAIPRVCSHVPRDGCVVQGERARHITAHVSFQDECHVTSASRYDQTMAINSGSEKQERNETRQNELEKHGIDIAKQERNMLLENTATWKYCELMTDQTTAIEANPGESAPRLHRVCVASEQTAFVVPSSNSSDKVGTGDANKVKTVKQEYAEPTRDQWHNDTMVMRTRESVCSKQEDGIPHSKQEDGIPHSKQEDVIPHSLEDIKPGQSDSCLMHSLTGRNKDKPGWTEPEGKDSSGDSTGTWKPGQHNTSGSVQAETTQERSAAVNSLAESRACDQVREHFIANLKTKFWQETSTQTLLKQSDFDDSLRLNQSIIVDNKGHTTLLKDSCTGTSDMCTESDVHPVDADTFKHDETATLDESGSGVPQVSSTAGCIKSLCSPVSSLVSKTEGIIRRVLSRSPDVKISHIQQKAMENLELFVKSTRECHGSGSEPRTSPPYKPSSQTPSSGDQELFLKDCVIHTPLQHTPSVKLKSSCVDGDTSWRDTKMHTDCSESILTYSKPSTDNVQMYNNAHKQTSLRTDTRTFHQQIPSTQCWMDSTSLRGSTSQSCLRANHLHVSGCLEPCSTTPANSHINADSGIYREVTQETWPDNNSGVHIPCWSNTKSCIFSSQNGDLGQNIMEPTRNPKLAGTTNEISKATLATTPGETDNFCMKEGETCKAGPIADKRQGLTNVARIQYTHSERAGPALFHQASGTAITLSNNTEKSQSASFTRSCTNPFLQSNTNPFMPSAPLLTVPNFQLEPSLLDLPRQPAPSLNIRPNPFLETFDVGKSVEDWPMSRSSRKDSPDSSTCFFKDNTPNKLNLWDIEELMSPLTAVTENRLENTHDHSKSKSLAKSYSRYFKMEDDLIFFSDASRDTDDRKPESNSKCSADKGVLRQPECPLIVLSYQEETLSKTRDEHWIKMPEQDGDDALQVTKTSSSEVYQAKSFNKQKARKRRQTHLKSRNNVGFSKAKNSKATCRFHKKHVCLADQPCEIGSIVDNSHELESGNKTSPDSLNKSISDNLTSHCLLLKKISDLQKSSASYMVYNSSEDSPDEAPVDASSSLHSLNSHISEDPADDIRYGRRPALSPSRGQTQTNDETANLNILETVTTLTSRFIDIFNGLKKNIHKSTGGHSRRHTAPNLERQRHYYYTPISKSAYPCRKSRNETTRPHYTSQQRHGSCHQDKHGHMVRPKSHSQFHNQNAYKLHKHAGKPKSSAMKKPSMVKSSNTATSTQSDDQASTSNSSEHCHPGQNRRGKLNDEFSISPHVYTEYKRMPVYSSNSESSRLRAVCSHTTCHIVNQIPSQLNQTTISDSETNVSATVEQSAVQAESAKDHMVSHQGALQAPQAQCHDNYHSYPQYAPHVFLPQCSQLYVSVHNGGCYVMPNMPFMSTVFTIMDDSYGSYLPEQPNPAPKLVLVDDGVGHEGAECGGVQADLSAAAMTQPTRKQTTPLPLATGKHVSRCPPESDSPDTATRHRMKTDQKASQHRAKPAPALGNDNGNLCETIPPPNDDFAHYVDVVPLLRNADIISTDLCTRQFGTCDALGEIVQLAEGLDSSWKEAHLCQPCRQYTNEPQTDDYDAVVNVKCTNHGEISSSNLQYDLARISASGFLSLHGQYYIKEDLSSPPKRRKCDHSKRTTCPAGASVSKRAPETGQHESRDYYQMDLGTRCTKKARTMDVRIPSMTFESRLKDYGKDTTPYFCYENARTPTFLSKIKDSPIKDGGVSITYSYKGRREYFSHILGRVSPLSDSLSDCSEKRESSTEMEVKAKTKDEKQYHYDDCEPDTYDELGSLCSEMQDTTSKLYQGDVEYATCKDPTGSYDSKSISLGPTFAALLESPHSNSNAATQTVQPAKRCTSYSHYFGTTVECSMKEATKSRLVAENKICQLPHDQANQFPMEQGYLLPMGQDCQLSAGNLEDSCYKNVAPHLWNIGLITLRSAPVTRSCFTQTDRGASGQESIRPNLAQIRDLMGRCIKSRHFRYYVQHIVDERVRNTLRQKVICNNDGNRTEKARAISLQKRNKKRQQPLNEADANGNTSARQTMMLASLPSLTRQGNDTSQEARMIATANTHLVRKSSSSGSICLKQGSEEARNEAGSMTFQWPGGVDHYVTYRAIDDFKSNNENLANNRQSENTMPEETSDFLHNSKKPLSFNSKDESNDDATNGVVSRSFPIAQTASEDGLVDNSAKPWNSAVTAQEVQKHHFCLSPLPRINNGSTEHLAGLNSPQEHSRVSNSERNTKTQMPIILRTATDANDCGKMTAEAGHIFESTNLQGQKATSSQPDAITVGADLTNHTKLEELTLTDFNTIDTALHNESAGYGRSLCEMDESARTRLVSTDYAGMATCGGGAQEMSDVSSSSSTKIDYGRLKNIMSAETKLLWKNLTLLEKSYDRCKRCRKQYESILGSNKISGECETKTEKLDTACELHSEDLNITRCSNQSTEMLEDSPREKCTSKNDDGVTTDTEQSQENMVTCVTDQYTHQVVDEVNTPPGQETNNTSCAGHTTALNASPVKDAACEDQFGVTKVVKDDTFKKPWHVKGKNTAKMIQIFERGNGFFQDNEQENASNHKKREGSNNEQAREKTSPDQQTHKYLRNTDSKCTGNAFLYTKKLKRSTGFDDEAKINCLERVIVSEHGTYKTDKVRETFSNTQSPSDFKQYSQNCDVANHHTANITDARHILAMNAPNSESDEWIQKLVNILHEMQQAFPQMVGTSANPAITHEHVDQTQEATDWPDKRPHSLRQGVSEKVDEIEMHEANPDAAYKTNLKWQRKTPINTPSLDHPADTFDQEHGHIASMACLTSQINSKETKLDLDKIVFHANKIEHHVEGEDKKPPDSGRTEEISDTVTQKVTPESIKTDRGKNLEKSQQRHTSFSWLLKSADAAPCLMLNTGTCSELGSPNKCMDENNQASGSLLPSDLLSYENVHVYDMIVAGDGKKEPTCQHTSGEPCYTTRRNLDRSPRRSCRDRCSHKPALEQIAICCDGKDISNTSSVSTIDTIRKVQSCITITKSYSSSDWAKNKRSLYPNPLKMSDSESQIQTLFERLYPDQDASCMIGSQLSKSPAVTHVTQDVFMISSGKTLRLLDGRAADTPRQATQFDWPKSAHREAYGCSTNTALQQANRNNAHDVRSAKRDIISKYEAKLLSTSRSSDCNVHESSADSCKNMASNLLKTDALRESREVGQCFTQSDAENFVTDLSQGSQGTGHCIKEIRDESEIYEQNTQSINWNLSSKTHRSNMSQSVSAETKQSNGGQALKHTSRLSSVLSEEAPGFGESYQLTMATLNDVRDTSLISNDEDFIDDIDTSIVAGHNIQTDSVGISPVKKAISHCDNASPLNTSPVFHERQVASKKTRDCSCQEICVCPAETRTDNRSYFPWKERSRKCYRFRKHDVIDTSTYNIIAKRLRGSSKRHKSASPPSVSLKEYISNESETASKDISSCLPSSKITSGRLDSGTHQTNQLQSFDIPIDIYTVPVYQCTSPQKKRKKKADLPTKTVVISGPVRNMSIAVQRHMRSYDQDGFTSRPRHTSSPDLAEGSPPMDTTNIDQIAVNGYDRKSVPNWRNAMKRMLPFGKRTTSNEKKIQTHIVT